MTYAGGSINEFTRIIIFAGARFALISFGFDQWFIGFCVVYLLYGLWFASGLVDHLMPMPSLSVGGQTVSGTGQEADRTAFRLSKFLEGISIL